MVALRASWRNFSLRTLLIAVTLVCCGLGWEVNVVRQRKAKLLEYQSKYYIQVVRASDLAARIAYGNPPAKLAKVNFLRGWLGDEAIQEIRYFPHMVKSPELALIRRWFPEATFSETYPMEPCHPGCFPWGTRIETANGRRRLSKSKSAIQSLPFCGLAR